MSINQLRPLFLFLLIGSSVYAQDKNAESKKSIPSPKSFITSHQGSFGGKTIRYTAIAKETYLKKQ